VKATCFGEVEWSAIEGAFPQDLFERSTDLNGDGAIDANDILDLIGTYGTLCDY